MNKKILGLLVVIAVVLVGAYQFVYVPYQNEQANQNYLAGLQDLKALDDDINQTMSKINDVGNNNITGGLEATTTAMKEIIPKLDAEITKLNETAAFANGNQTKEQYINYEIQVHQIEKDLLEESSQQYTDLSDAIKKQDLKRMLNISQEIQNTYNTKADQLKPIQDNIIKLLNDNPDFNQTLHSLNLSEEYYGQMNLTHLTA